MKKRVLTDEDIKLINGIIKNINANKLLKYRGESSGDLGYYVAMDYMISILKAFYGSSVNEGIWAAILRKDLGVYRALYNKFFLDTRLFKLVQDDSCSYIVCGNENLFYFEGVHNYINLVDNKMSLGFKGNELAILYESNVGEHCNVRLSFDDEGLVKRREIKKEMLPIRINGRQGYGMSSIVTVERDDNNPCYVSVVDSLKITEHNKVTVMANKQFAGYIHPSSLFDLDGFSKLSEECIDDVMTVDSCFRVGFMLDRYFPNIRQAFIDRLNKRNGYSRKRDKK